MAVTYRFAHDLASNTIECTTIVDGVQVSSRNYSAIQRDELLTNSSNAAAPYAQIAGWTDAYISALVAEEQRIAAEAQAIADAKAAAEHEAEVQRQMAIIAEAQARLAAQNQV